MHADRTPKKSRSTRFLLGFVVLLAASHLVRWIWPVGAEVEGGGNSVQLQAVLADPDESASGDPVNLAYRDLLARAPDAPVLVLLHGSPMRASSWQPFVDKWSGIYRLIIPELHGSGGSQKKLPDYSASAAAGYVAQLLEKLDVGRAHLVGFSTGGTVALHLQHAAPEKIASLSLLAPLAVSQLELVGDPTLNRAVYWAQKFYIWCGLNLLPHFGLLDHVPADMNYARHYHQTDTRRLEEVIQKIEPPVLLIHGEDDLIRPAAASRELARLIPQAETLFVDGGHSAPLEQVAIASAAIGTFVAKVENNAATTRESATPARLAAAQEDFSYGRYSADLAARITLMVVLLAIATLISEDITCITAGILAASGMLSFFHATLGCFLGIFIGDVGLYLLGRVLGPKAIRVPPLRWFIKEEQLLASERFFAKYGAALVIVTRWLPGMRIPTYVAAGVLKLKFRVFLFYFLIAAVIWTPLLVGISMLIGGTLLGWLESIEDYAGFVLIGVIAVVWIAAHFVMKSAGSAIEKRIEQS